MRSAFIVDGLRTPIGRRGGSLKGIHAIDLLGLVIENLVSRNDIDPIDVDDVIAGCVSQLGEQTGNVGRNAALAAGLPERFLEQLLTDNVDHLSKLYTLQLRE